MLFTMSLKIGDQTYTTHPKKFKDGNDAQEYWINKIREYDNNIVSLSFETPNCAIILNESILNKMIFIIEPYNKTN